MLVESLPKSSLEMTHFTSTNLPLTRTQSQGSAQLQGSLVNVVSRLQEEEERDFKNSSASLPHRLGCEVLPF